MSSKFLQTFVHVNLDKHTHPTHLHASGNRFSECTRRMDEDDADGGVQVACGQADDQSQQREVSGLGVTNSRFSSFDGATTLAAELTVSIDEEGEAAAVSLSRAASQHDGVAVDAPAEATLQGEAPQPTTSYGEETSTSVTNSASSDGMDSLWRSRVGISSWRSMSPMAKVDFDALDDECAERTPNNFLKRCLWSPDGTSLATNSSDACVRLFQLAEAKEDGASRGTTASAATASHSSQPQYDLVNQISIPEGGEMVYDLAWYPLMSWDQPETHAIATTCRSHPVHLWDSSTGDLRATYRNINRVDEVAACHSLQFTPDGQRLYCGFETKVHVFDVSRPGRDYEARPLKNKRTGMNGIVSSLAFNSDGAMYACGTFGKKVGLYVERDGECCGVANVANGVTHMKFTQLGAASMLLVGTRVSSALECFDIRCMASPVFTIPRPCGTNQRLYFDTTPCGQYAILGLQTGEVQWVDLAALNNDPYLSEQQQQRYAIHSAAVDGAGVVTWRGSLFKCESSVSSVACHPWYNWIAMTTGQRRFANVGASDSSSSDSDSEMNDDSGADAGAQSLVASMDNDACASVTTPGAGDTYSTALSALATDVQHPQQQEGASAGCAGEAYHSPPDKNVDAHPNAAPSHVHGGATDDGSPHAKMAKAIQELHDIESWPDNQLCVLFA
eukprot:m.13016 g.13016  ORF g.13016 m.13016 type:complete len:674 (-) comp5893_c0_seq1:426-2447(-)